MATIDREVLLADLNFWLPSSNKIDDTGLTKISDLVITAIGDDEDNYEEILCKSLKACANKNKVDSNVASDTLKKFKYGGTEEEYFRTSNGGWESYIEDLPELCLSFGYVTQTLDEDGEVSSLGGIYISPGDAVDLFEDYEGTSGYPYETDPY